MSYKVAINSILVHQVYSSRNLMVHESLSGGATSATEGGEGMSISLTM